MRLSDRIKEHAAVSPEEAYQRAGYTEQLKKQGNNLVGVCPFHPDTDPSFKISLTGDAAGCFKCFGCGASGSIVDFVKQSRNLATDGEAVKVTAELLGVTDHQPIRKPSPPRRATTDKPLNAISPKIAETHHKILLAEKNQKHLERFMEVRALSLGIIKKAKIGFDGDRYTIPVFYADELLDIRKYAPGDDPKFLAWEKGTGGTHIYAWDWVGDATDLVLTEGELDALTLLDHDIPAFSVTNGAGKWPDDPPDLTGKTICICGDADEAGRSMNESLSLKLYAAGAAQVKVFHWPPDAASGYDVTQFFVDGGTAGAFGKLMGKATVVEPPYKTKWTLRELLEHDFPEPRFVVPDILPCGLTMMGGRPKIGKSFFALQLLIAVANGGQFLGRQVTQGRALYLALEDSPRRIGERLARMGAEATDLGRFEFDWPLLAKGGGEQLGEEIMGGQWSLLVVDTFSRLAGVADQDAVAEMTTLLSPLQQAAVRADVTVLVIDHFKKSVTNDPVDDLLGSTGKAAVPDCVLGLYRRAGSAPTQLLVRGRDLQDVELGLEFDPTNCCWQVVADIDGVVAGSAEQRLLDHLAELGGKGNATELAAVMEISRPRVHDLLGSLLSKGKLVKLPREGQVQPYMLSEVFQERLFPGGQEPEREPF